MLTSLTKTMKKFVKMENTNQEVVFVTNTIMEKFANIKMNVLKMEIVSMVESKDYSKQIQLKDHYGIFFVTDV